MMKRIFFTVITIITIILFVINKPVFSQEKQFKIGCIGFYNLENLFDTIDDPNTIDEEFLPNGINKWTGERYKTKIAHLSEVISQIGGEFVKGGPIIMGFAEVENRQVIEDLINTPALKPLDYGIVHFDSPDKRGVDVALIYQKQYFKVTNSMALKLTIPGVDDFFSRDQLVVSGIFDGEPLYVIVNHWPSRSGGEKKSAPLRNTAAKLCRSIVDSIMKIDINAKILIMGDLNDDPTDASLVKYLNAKGDIKKVAPGDLYNPMLKMFKIDGIGSLAYRDSWNLFDQIIVSSGLTGEDKSTYKFYKSFVFNKKFLTQTEGAYAGYPFRTYAGGVYSGGYSDHFPVYVFLVKEKK
jgi:hypothetical protein